MSTDHDVRRALHELAEGAPPVSAIATGDAMRRIRRARLARQCTTAALSVTATAAVAAVAVTVARPLVAPAPPGAQPSTRQSQTATALCGDTAGTIGNMSVDGSPLAMTMTAVPPLSISDGTPQVSVVVTNNSDTVVSSITSVHPAVILVRDGLVVTAPVGVRSVGVELDLAPGASHTFATPVSLTACQTDGPGPEAPDKVPVSTSAGPLVEPGTYQLYATQTFLVRDAAHPDGRPVEVHGGPWEIVLR